MTRYVCALALLTLCFAPAAAAADAPEPRTVIVVYRPHEGKEAMLRELLRKHVPILREQGLATDRAPIFLRTSEGLYVEVFEWKSAAAIAAAHQNLAVRTLWEEFARACSYATLADLREAAQRFPDFDRVAVNLE